ALLRGLIETAEKIGRPKFGAPSMNYLSLPFRDLFLVQEARRLNEEALEVVRREGGWGMPGMQAEIDLMITDLLQGDIGRVERETAVAESDALGTPSARWQQRTALGRIRYATGDDDGAARAYGEAAEIIRTYAEALSPEHAEAFLSAEPVREVVKSAR